MCGSHQLSRPPGHKQPSSGQTLSSVCRAWGHVTATWSEEQWMDTTQDEREWRRNKQFSQSSIHYFSHCVKFLKTRPSPCSLCLFLIDTDCALLVSRPGAVPSGTNILWPYGPSGDQSHRNTENKKLNFILSTKHKPLNIWTLETTIFSHQKCFYKSPFPYFRFQDCETDPRSLPSSCLIVKYNTSIIFNIRNSLIRTIPKLRPPLPSHIHIWSEILQLQQIW